MTALEDDMAIETFRIRKWTKAERELAQALRDRNITLDEILVDDNHTCTVQLGYDDRHNGIYCGEIARYATSQLIDSYSRPSGYFYCHYRCQKHLDSLLKK